MTSINTAIDYQMMEKEMAKLENPLIRRLSSWA